MRIVAFVLLLLFQLSCSATEKSPVAPVTPCRTANGSAPPAKECEAAAVAEDAFKEYTHGSVKTYRIYPAGHTSTKWVFIVQEWVAGATEPVPGGHWLVNVERASGKTELIPGV
jgi:hypothetical protein